MSQYLHRQSISRPGPKRIIMDISFVNDDSIFVLFRVVLTSTPVLRSFSHQLLLDHNMGIRAAITQLQNQSVPQTDYLLISEPAVDMGVIPVQSGAEFCF